MSPCLLPCLNSESEAKSLKQIAEALGLETSNHADWIRAERSLARVLRILDQMGLGNSCPKTEIGWSQALAQCLLEDRTGNPAGDCQAEMNVSSNLIYRPVKQRKILRIAFFHKYRQF